ncbi:MAG: hypothetical protein Ct9H300mP23_06740 [Nitrospinota bacterium]|nr:MAG: hypothetical protein Ct9H300mP23_06740 [Nitrospinota bacterium]
MCGAISGIFGFPGAESLAASVKDRFIGKGIVVSGGTPALDRLSKKNLLKSKNCLKQKKISRWSNPIHH